MINRLYWPDAIKMYIYIEIQPYLLENVLIFSPLGTAVLVVVVIVDVNIDYRTKEDLTICRKTETVNGNSLKAYLQWKKKVLNFTDLITLLCLWQILIQSEIKWKIFSANFKLSCFRIHASNMYRKVPNKHPGTLPSLNSFIGNTVNQQSRQWPIFF